MSVIQQIQGLRANVGLWRRDTHTILQFTGPDAGAWLQAQTSNDVLKLKSGEGAWNALLDRQGRTLALFTCHRWEDEFWLLLPRDLVPAIQNRVDTHLFLEQVQVADVGEGGQHILVEGPRAHSFLAGLATEDTGFPSTLHAFSAVRLLDREVLLFRQTVSGEDGYLLVPVPEEAEDLYHELLDRGQDFFATELQAPAQRAALFEGGLGEYGAEITAEQVISETPYEAYAVSYDKGCFLGQEVVQRMKSYGSPKRALMGLLVFDEDAPLPQSFQPMYDGQDKAGFFCGAVWAPWRSAWLIHAYLDRAHRTPGQTLHLSASPGGGTFEAEVASLPLRVPPSRQEFAQTLYQQALEIFGADEKDEDTAAIDLLQEAILLDPALEDAYEALGVILHRHHRVDEAITWMRRLERLNPNSVMAHSNLSVFYVAKGMIAEAEAEKAKAANLQSRRELDTQEAHHAAVQQRAQIRQEAEERILLFQEVLEMDTDDPVATMGMGRSHVQLEQFAEALPWFEAATSARKDYSAAYLEWGKCLEVLGRREEAVAVYKQGIEAAGRKGDLMPLREMERRLRALREESPTTL